MPEQLWNIEKAAEWLGVPVDTVYKWRRKRGRSTHAGHSFPRGVKLGREVRYDPEDIRQWWANEKAAA